MSAWLILETSGRSRVGLAVGGAVVASADLGGGRQHNRLLLPTVADLLTGQGLTPKSLAGVAVGVGPGSYTGLRVGVTAAKTLAYTVGCSLVAVPSFAAIAAEAGGTVDVIADALQGLIYVQRFVDGVAAGELRIVPFEEWVNQLTPPPLRGRSVPPKVEPGGGSDPSTPPSRLTASTDLPLKGGGVQVAGPGVTTFAAKLPVGVVRSPVVEPSVEAVFGVSQTLQPLSSEEVMKLEPLYLRGSSAEEKVKRDQPT